MSWRRLVLQLLATSVGLFLAYAYLLRLERRAMAHLMLRGERRWGALWPLVDALRALSKPCLGMRRWAWAGPAVGLGLALAAFCLLPAGPDLYLGHQRVWAAWPVPPANLFVLVLLGLLPAVIPWSIGELSDQGGVREAGLLVARRAVAYSAPALLALAGAALVAGEFTLDGLVRWQAQALPLAVYQPLGLALFSLASVLASRRLPASDDARSPALLAFHLQHAGTSWALAHLGEYLGMFYTSAVIARVYVAGWAAPWAGSAGLALKTLAVMAALLWLRQRWYADWRPRLERHAWGLLMVLGAANAVVTAAAVLWRNAR